MRYLRGPSINAACPTIEIILDTSDLVAGSANRVLKALADNSEGIGKLDVPQAFAQAIVFLQRRVGVTASFWTVRPATPSGHRVVAVECPHEIVGLAAAEIALRLINDAKHGDVALTPEEEQRLKAQEYESRYPYSTAEIVNAARRRCIPVRRLSTEYARILLLGQGSKQHLCQASEPDTISAMAETNSTDKYLAKELMTKAGVPVPIGKLVDKEEDAWGAAQELGLPVAMKPQDCDLQIGVTLDLRTREGVEAAFRHAKQHSTWVLIEQFAPGVEHRVLVVDGKIVAVTRIDPPQVLGDGEHTIAELVALVNRDPRRGELDSDCPWSKLFLDDVAVGVLAVDGLTVNSIPANGQSVLVRRNPPYFKYGGNLIDLTDVIHPSIATHAAAAADVMRLPVAGLDVVALDIRQPLETQQGVVIEINAGPGLWLHMAPWAESPRPVGDAIVASMFPPGKEGRIPVVALISDGDSAASSFLQTALSQDGRRVGYVGRTEFRVAGRRWPAPADPHERAQQLLQYPGIDLAILETTPEELLRSGFANDRCDLALLVASNPAISLEDGLALETGEFLKAIRHALTPNAPIVTIAQDESVVKTQVSSAELFLVGQSADQTAGRPAISTDPDDHIIVTERSGRQTPIGKCPVGLSEGDRQGLLAGLAGGIAFGIPQTSLQAYLASLQNRPK